MISQLIRFKSGWPALALLILIVGLSFIRFGYWVAEQHYNAEIANLKTAWETQRKDAAEKHSQALRTELDKQTRAGTENQRLTAELLNASAALAVTQEQLKRSVNHAIKSDGAIYSGLGPDSLRLYIAAFGYPAGTGNQLLPGNPGGVTENAEAPSATGERQP